jgi:hypothetical protein
MIKRIVYVCIACLALLALWGLGISGSLAQEGTGERLPGAPEEINAKSNYIPVQGRLTDPSGTPLDGDYTISLRIYSSYTGGTALCQDLDNLEHVKDGLFLSYMDMTNCRAFDGRQLYLSVQVGSDAEMTPRQYIDNVPYAYGLRPGAVISSTMGNNAILHIENWATNGRGLRAYGMSQTGVNYGIVGASRSPDGFGGYFYNNGGGVGLWVQSTNGNAIKAEGENAVTILATNTNSPAVWATSLNDAGVHGVSGEGAGVEGFSINGPGVYAENLTGGVAIAANGTITSTAPTYLWISGNDVVRYVQSESTIINIMSNGGAALEQGNVASYKNMVLPITIAGTLYGQNVRLTALDIYWQGETAFEAITDMRLRRQTGACWNCYAELIHDPADYTCDDDTNAEGCTLHYDLTTNNVLTSDSGILYLFIQVAFGGPSEQLRLGGARLTLEYDN